jgi:hypothetical protein
MGAMFWALGVRIRCSWGSGYLMGVNLKVVRVKFSTLSSQTPAPLSHTKHENRGHRMLYNVC